MEYLAFALKYRPQDFDEVIGQEHVVSALKNAIVNKRVHHAYIFSGPRGIGKTSLARILAKALNCEQGPTIKPCGKCLSCTEITKGISLDVIEIDGASNRGIDDIRALREAVKLSPAYSRYKIYIIDEVHQITSDGFNALLKTLEEPPAHVKFIFATTHPQKILPTILSRCQKFQFNLLTLEKIVRKLEAIVKRENIKIDKNILYSIARSAGGSIRDAESLLDQIVPIILEKGELSEVISFLGIIDEDSLNTIVKFIVEKDIKESLDFIQKITEGGKDLGVFANSIIEHLRNLLIAKVSVKTFKQLKDISPASKDFILKLSASITPQELLEIIDLLIEAKDLSKKLHSIRIPLELAIIKFSLKKENSFDNHHKTTGGSKTANSLKVPESKAVEDDLDFEIEDLEPKVSKKEIKEKSNDAGDVSYKAPAVTGTETDSGVLLKDIAAKWPAVISEIGKTRMSLASYLGEASLVSFEKGTLKLGFEKRFSFHKEIVESAKNLKSISDYLARYLKLNVGIKCVLLENSAASSPAKQSIKQGQVADEDNDFINELLDTFDGKLHTGNE